MFGLLMLRTLSEAGRAADLGTWQLPSLTLWVSSTVLQNGLCVLTGAMAGMSQIPGLRPLPESAPTLVGPKEAFLSVLPFQSADAKI